LELESSPTVSGHPNQVASVCGVNGRLGLMLLDLRKTELAYPIRFPVIAGRSPADSRGLRPLYVR